MEIIVRGKPHEIAALTAQRQRRQISVQSATIAVNRENALQTLTKIQERMTEERQVQLQETDRR